MKFVLATANQGKIREMQEILSEFDIEIVTRKDLGIEIDVEETGTTLRENALIKAKAICALSGLPAIADDSGLFVEALNGGPGVYSSTYGGEELDALQRCSYLLIKMQNAEQRSAKFVCTIVCAFPDGTALTAEGECTGEIITKPRGSSGFGYDPVFLVNGSNRTMAELTPEDKNRVSHRGKALRAFTRMLRDRSIV